MAAARVLTPGGEALMVASIHARTEPSVVPHLEAIFDTLGSHFEGSSHVIGGDHNSRRLADSHFGPIWDHREFFERIERSRLASSSGGPDFEGWVERMPRTLRPSGYSATSPQSGKTRSASCNCSKARTSPRLRSGPFVLAGYCAGDVAGERGAREQRARGKLPAWPAPGERRTTKHSTRGRNSLEANHPPTRYPPAAPRRRASR